MLIEFYIILSISWWYIFSEFLPTFQWIFSLPDNIWTKVISYWYLYQLKRSKKKSYYPLVKESCRKRTKSSIKIFNIIGILKFEPQLSRFCFELASPIRSIRIIYFERTMQFPSKLKKLRGDIIYNWISRYRKCSEWNDETTK